MNQNINQLISKLFRGDFRTKKHCCKRNNVKFTMAKQIVEGGCGQTTLVLRTRKLVDRIYSNFMRRYIYIHKRHIL